MADWATISSLATAGGTLVLAGENGWLGNIALHRNLDLAGPR